MLKRLALDHLLHAPLIRSNPRPLLADLRMETAMLLRLALDLPLRALLIRSNLQA